LVSLLVVYQGRKKKLAVFPAVLVNAAFGLLAYILYRLLCPTLAKALGCFWPSLLLMPLCKWFLLLDLLVFGLTAILLAGSFSKKKEMSPSA